KLWYQNFNYSVPEDLVEGANARGTGTSIRIWPDAEIFETTDFDFDTISRRLQEMAFLNKGLTMTLTDHLASDEELKLEALAEQGDTAVELSLDQIDADGETQVVDAEVTDDPKKPKKREKKKIFHYPNGLEDYVNHLNRTKTA